MRSRHTTTQKRSTFPFWDKNGIYVSIDGSQKYFTESRLWWPYWRSTYWGCLADNITLSAGTHTITISVDVKGVQFHGFRVCSAFSEYPFAGSASFTLSPRHFIDVDGKECQPDKGFKHPLYEMCLREGRYVPVEEVHHIIPLSEGGTNDESNLMSLCRSCHEKIHHERGDR